MTELWLALTVLAIFISPILALWLTEWWTNRKEIRERRLRLFATLMATRSATLSPDHINALNAIDVVFYKNLDIIPAWETYRAQFYVSPSEWEQNAKLRENLFDDMLQKMGRQLGYHFDIKSIKTPSYYPLGYVDAESDNAAIRRNWREVLERWNHLARKEAANKPPDES